MAYKTGQSKPLDDISLNDVLQYPIWEWALDEEGIEGQDETWQRPVLNTNDVTDEMFTPTITLKIKDTEIYASAEYESNDETISAISVWNENHWSLLNEVDLSIPIILISVPKIKGIENVVFILKSKSDDVAKRI
jgi:hypothetical protein